MAWVSRYGGRRYYYRQRRIGGRVVKEYVGKGAEAKLAAAIVEERRMQGLQDRAMRDHLQRVWSEADEPLNGLIDICRVLTHAALLVHGYYQHHRGDWRRRRQVEQA